MLVDHFHALSSIVAPPPTDLVSGSLTALQCLSCLRGLGEITSPMKYSKFADEDVLSQNGAVNARLGFIIIYGPALLAVSCLLAVGPGNSLVSSLLFAHYGKRVMEALVLHDFSGSKGMFVSAAAQISSYYVLITCMIATYAVPRDSANHGAEMMGLTIFVVGELGNFYHHWLLRGLKQERSESGRRYVPPRGSLFELVATPHYLFEVMSWVGLAFVAQQFNAYLEVVSTLGYFMVRSKNTNEMYFKTFSKEEWPRHRKNLIPFFY